MAQRTMLNIAGIEEDSITDGPGLRFVLFVQGCPHHCEGCHNPETHEFGVGEEKSVEELFERIKGNPLQSGVTFSGGEPFCQPEGLAKLAHLLKEAGYHLASFSGFTFEQLIASTNPAIHDLLSQLDILVDGPFILAERDLELRFRGSRNQRVLDVPASLKAGKAIPTTDDNWDYTDCF